MALFEGYERRIEKINGVLKEYGIGSIEECKDICLSKGVDCEKIVRGTQPICFDNAVWAYTVGAAIAIKKGCKKAADAAAAYFSGELTDVNVQYGMFSVSGKPVHSVVTLRIAQQLTNAAEDTKWNLTKFNECFSGKQSTNIGQKMGNLLNITGF